MQPRSIGMSTYVKWKQCQVGAYFQGIVTRIEHSKDKKFASRPAFFIQQDNGQEIGLSSTGQMVHSFKKERIVPGNYIRVTYKGRGQLQSKSFGSTEVVELDIEIFDEMDRSSDPRFAARAPQFLAWYDSLDGNGNAYSDNVQQYGYAPGNIPQPPPQGYVQQAPANPYGQAPAQPAYGQASANPYGQAPAQPNYGQAPAPAPAYEPPPPPPAQPAYGQAPAGGLPPPSPYASRPAQPTQANPNDIPF